MKKGIIIFSIFFLLAVIVYAADSRIFVNYNFLGNNITNVSYINVTKNITIGDCAVFANGGKFCGNTTCSSVYSPNGLTVVQSCD